MSINIPSLELDRLSVGERLKLIDLIWESLPQQVDSADVPEWHLIELTKRRAEAEATPGAGRPWREVLDQLGPKS